VRGLRKQQKNKGREAWKKPWRVQCRSNKQRGTEKGEKEDFVVMKGRRGTYTLKKAKGEYCSRVSAKGENYT